METCNKRKILQKIFQKIRLEVNKFFKKKFILTRDVFNHEKIQAYWSDSDETHNNFGDRINPFLLEKILSKPIVHSSNLFESILCNRPKIFFIGSILSKVSNQNSVVLGAGFMKNKPEKINAPKKIYAVRGPLTRKIYIENGIFCPERYCDPALLLPRFVNTNSIKKYDVGIIPHYADKIYCNNTCFLSEDLTLKIIDIETDAQKFVDSLYECRTILSSTLHGIIVAHAYGIPATWIEFSNKVVGDGFKFEDYFLSLGEVNIKKFTAKNNYLDVVRAVSELKTYDVTKNLTDLDSAIVQLKKDFHIGGK